MAFQIRGSGHANTKAGGSGTTVVFTSDALTQLGDLLIVGRGDNNSGPVLTGPAGWAQVPAGGIADAGTTNSIKADLWWKVAAAGDVGATAYTFTSNSTVAMHGGIFAIYDDAGGTWGANPFDNAVTTANAVDSTSGPTNTTLTTAQANELLIALASCGVTAGATFTPPAGMTEAIDSTAGAGSTTIAWGTQVAAGAVAAQTFTISTAFDSSVTILAAFILTPPTSNPLRGNLALSVYRGG
jgi:hypothetical protein